MNRFLPTRILTHQQKVCSLYKRACRNIESWNFKRNDIELQRAQLRHRFDQNADVKDLLVANNILKEGERELLYSLHPQQKKFSNSPGGVAFERAVVSPDWVLDFWHPIEKAAYPEYFARRELRKKEFIKLWQNKFGRKI